MPQLSLKEPSLYRQQAFIAGRWVDAHSHETLDVVNPANGQVIAKVPAMDQQDTREAIQAAEAIRHEFAEIPAAERAGMLERWYQLILDHTEDLAIIMTAEQGKSLEEARGEVRYGASFVKWFAEEARRIYGETLPSPTRDRRILVLKQPVGIAAAITPWNFPIAMITRKCAPALAAGCPIIVKPSDLTPLSALALAELASRAGIPGGALQIVTGMPQGIGAELTGNPLVRKLSFTGSTRVGQLLMRQCADSVKRLSFELGGNAPFIVFDDADIDLAIAGVMVSKFRNGGQTCVCANRILVQRGIYDQFAARLVEETRRLKVGDGFAEGTQIGPLINKSAVEKVNRHIDDALSQGARLLTGGIAENEGNFAKPTVLADVNASMLIANEETFGPVAPLFCFDNEQEAIDLANATPFGLAAYFFTENLRRSWRVAEKLEFGMVGLNTGSVSLEIAPFGGIKLSGIGREGAKAGIEEYLEMKSFHIGGLN
ncbi:NAD-dependent succinate-semialdehyde dehydrogenase [Rouxiella badensis]|jgi:succinate-semialdehyde dehydrogenase/glutarate-semialdehyde dehydrogenase|uniref:Succinate-semialdehyde dehydrogenase (NADP(+)) n=1 Tax=Rouxiella badensis TaxID=1646377 RepID=A0A1X0WE38_9GAMM|nr:NAD-dependent succinate-semialdehyde dehydrogenase [Rouxiella badensis]MCC3718192.1 NAD-dependent succinate-semialdehyde dehydrogenase [Rouxiella badensis]MCC3727040.1 NAD-dependent succinate-semialdehyde dehydrogenase [Rouxiella badensis]MCC3731676.1 NAD-dependent succinate-semialdehyde dehydrogenase [Rouxiella badensis]MCC3738611.1 NAD-dependent succinate-semialdehyde dehydrogenase [Rouxiella badensis]MCC3757065.1 NAD-dependent succinate-semialdehyde dehydrogenase [Rouxiella badensis]